MDSIVIIPLSGPSPLHGRDRGADLAWPEFIAGPENRLVEPAVRSVIEDASTGFNPVLFRGPSGTGKTHLARGLSLAWKARHPRRRVIYTSADEYANELGEAIATHATDDFRARYQNAALVVVEEIDRLAARYEVQEDLVQLLDVRLASGSRVVLTASSAPAAMTARLQSRLDAGLTVGLAAPGSAARLAILPRLARLLGRRLSEAGTHALAAALQGTVPKLLETLERFESATGPGSDAKDVETAYRSLVAERARGHARLGDIATTTARLFAVKASELRSPSRRRAVVTARGVAMYLARQLTGKSLDQLGRYFGGRDHTTVMYGCRKTERLLRHDPAIRRAVEQVQERLWASHTEEDQKR